MERYIYRTLRVDSSSVELSEEENMISYQESESCVNASLSDYRRDYYMSRTPPDKQWKAVFRRALIKLRGYRLWKMMLDDIRVYGTGCTLFDADDYYKRNLQEIMDDKVMVNRVEGSAGILNNQWIFKPDGKFNAVWNTALLVLILYTFTVLPFLISFEEFTIGTPYFWVEFMVDLFFFFDIFVTLNTAYVNKSGQLIRTRKKIIRHYVKTTLIFDIISIFPFHMLTETSNTAPRLLKLTRVVRIIKAKKLSGLYSKALDYFSVLNLYQGVTRLILGMFIVLLMTHFIACMWYMSARVEEFSPKTWIVRNLLLDSENGKKYLSSLYWACTVLTTVGYGDITAMTKPELILSIIWMVCGIGFYSLVVGSLSSVLSSLDEKQEAIRSKLDLLELFIRNTQLPYEMGREVKKKLQKELLKLTLDSNERISLIESLSKNLRYKISMAMYDCAARKIDFFNDKRKKSKAFISDILPRLAHKHYSPKKTVYKKDKYADEMYFITEGRVTFIYGSQRLSFKDMIRGAYFGEIEIIEQIPREFGAVTLQQSHLLIMGKDTFDYMMKQYPFVAKEIREVARKRKRKNNLAKGEIIDVLEIVEVRRLHTYDELAGKPYLPKLKIPETRGTCDTSYLEGQSFFDDTKNAVHNKFDNLERQLDTLTEIVIASVKAKSSGS